MRKTLLTLGTLAAGSLLLAACATSRAVYETAAFILVKKEGAFEIRDYPALTVVSTEAASSAERDGRFMKLFGYISGKNERQEKIKMTTPVLMGQAMGQSRMSFVVPAKTASAGAPAAASPDIKVGIRPAARYAVLRFTGLQNPAREQQALAELNKQLTALKLTAAGEPVFAYYDPPWTPGPVRRNEVMLPLAKS